MVKTISLLDIVEDTVVDGPGFRLTLYGAGCVHRCKKCHNPQSWNINHGKRYSIDEIWNRIKSYSSNITFSGGDPFFQVHEFTLLAQKIKAESNKTIWCYTGYRYEQIVENESMRNMLGYIDVLIDGRFINNMKDPELLFRGSSNQRIIDVKASIRDNRVIPYQYQPFPEF
ncbi:MAG: anaerobic ribonucleoside-triphosphate reductase activating protein [Bacteroidales bacterium]